MTLSVWDGDPLTRLMSRQAWSEFVISPVPSNMSGADQVVTDPDQEYLTTNSELYITIVQAARTLLITD